MAYITEAVKKRKLSGNGHFSTKCQEYFRNRYHFNRCLLTTSCTDALEMIALLLNIKPGDEVIMPSYTFVSTANAFVLRGARIIFADCLSGIPNIDPDAIEPLISPRTIAIVVVHYAGISCDMDMILNTASKYNLYVVEDAAQAIDSYYKGKPLGSMGHLSAFSFHETKNIISGEGGMLVINDEKFNSRAEIIWEKGTNRAALFRGEVDKYNWVDVGSSFLPSEIIAAFLYAQLEALDNIQARRKEIWNRYHTGLKKLHTEGKIKLPKLPEYATNNAHMYFFTCEKPYERDHLLQYLKEAGINAVFHYLSLHESPFYKQHHDGRSLPNCDHFSNALLRLPFYYELTVENQQYIIDNIIKYFAIH